MSLHTQRTALVRLPFLLCALLLSLPAADLNLQPQGYLSDFAQVVNPAHRAEIERYCARVQQLTSAEIAIVTIPSLDGEPIEDAANSLYRKWGVGKKGKNEGVLLLLAVHDRRMRLEVGYGLEPILPDGLAGELLDNMRPLLRRGEYGPALLEATHQLGSIIAKSKNVTIDVTLPSRREVPPEPEAWFPLFIPILFLLLLIWMSRRRGGFASPGPWFFPGGGWSSGSGGGFGGYDSSDSFGGFGGGDSGGGGANSDW
ncbi:MAG: hypothetical protein IANPNBLG_00676 [Bryobacteraceae bacterium]|nr:hypothetical protein [Bryobacteraceae bacterium]